MKAIAAGDLDASWSLIQAGADPEATDLDGLSAIDYAHIDYETWDRQEILAAFKDAIDSRDTQSGPP